MWSTTKYASLFSPVVGVPFAYFALFSGGCNFCVPLIPSYNIQFLIGFVKQSAATITFANLLTSFY